MDAANELSQFLTSRRAKVTPQQAGLPTYGQRRVPGLRREEVASLAGVRSRRAADRRSGARIRARARSRS